MASGSGDPMMCGLKEIFDLERSLCDEKVKKSFYVGLAVIIFLFLASMVLLIAVCCLIRKMKKRRRIRKAIGHNKSGLAKTNLRVQVLEFEEPDELIESVPDEEDMRRDTPIALKSEKGILAGTRDERGASTEEDKRAHIPEDKKGAVLSASANVTDTVQRNKIENEAMKRTSLPAYALIGEDQHLMSTSIKRDAKTEEGILESRDGYSTISVSMKDDGQASEWAEYSEVSMSMVNDRQSVVDYSTVRASMINSKQLLESAGEYSTVRASMMSHEGDHEDLADSPVAPPTETAQVPGRPYIGMAGEKMTGFTSACGENLPTTPLEGPSSSVCSGLLSSSTSHRVEAPKQDCRGSRDLVKNEDGEEQLTTLERIESMEELLEDMYKGLDESYKEKSSHDDESSVAGAKEEFYVNVDL